MLAGALEVTAGCMAAAGAATPLLFLVGFFLSFGGVSVHCQIRTVLQKHPAALKDFFLFRLLHGLLGGGLALIYPAEPMLKADQAGEMLDIIRFYIHHGILFMVPLLMVMLKLHTISYKRVAVAPACLLLVMLFIMLNQVLQSELGFVPLRGDNFFEIGYKNSAYIWGPDDAIGNFIAKFCPDLFKTVPVDKFAGQTKYWPWVWLVVPAFVLITPLAFFLSLIFDGESLKADVTSACEKCKEALQYRK
jgi:hypothetical protein